jgi:hypothetical protein
VAGDRVGFAQAYVPLWQSSAELNRDFDAIKATGAQWVRFDMVWSVVQAGGPTSFDWSTTDRAVAAANARGLKVLAVLGYTPTWARAPGASSDKYPPADPNTFATYARAAAQRYAPQGVHSYEIWNEENTGFWAPLPNPVTYTQLLKLAYPAIKTIDASATVIVGGFAGQGDTNMWKAADGSGIAPYRFLTEMYAAGAAGSFDAVAIHPYSIPGGPSAGGEWNPFTQAPAIHTLMANHGDTNKRIWATEGGAWTGTSPNAVSETTQAQYARDYLTLWTQWSYTGPFFLYTLRDRSTNTTDREDNFGVMHTDGTPKTAYQTISTTVIGP